MKNILAAMQAQDRWAEKTYPQVIIFKRAGGFGETILGMVKAGIVQGKAQWGTTHEPKYPLPADLQKLQEVNAELKKLSRKRRVLLERAYKRGVEITITEAVKVSEEREAR